MRHYLKNIAVLGLTTIASRVLGLLRDILAYSSLGISGFHSAFTIAYAIPNLFRRLLGEGALSTALIPVYTSIDEDKDAFLNQVLSWVGLLLILLILLGISFLSALSLLPNLEARTYLALKFTTFLLPYMLFVCLAAMLGAVLNVKGKFALVGMSQVWLNSILILSILYAQFIYKGDNIFVVNAMISAIILGGFLQMIIPAILLIRLGWKPKLNFSITPHIKELYSLMLPAVFGAGILQFNQMLIQFFALAVNESGAAILYLSSRLIELPLGVFAIAISTVVFPSIAQFTSSGNHSNAAAAYSKGLRLIILIVLPATIGLVLLKENILQVLFQWGAFTHNDVQAVAKILGISALAIPFYSISSLATKGFHAKKDMKTPSKVALLVLFLNLLLSSILTYFYGITGLATSSLLIAIIHSLLLQSLLKYKSHTFRSIKLFSEAWKVLIGLLIMGPCVTYLSSSIDGLFGSGKIPDLLELSIIILSAIILYSTTLLTLKHQELRKSPSS